MNTENIFVPLHQNHNNMIASFKVTAWQQVEIPDHISEEFLDKLESGEIESLNDAYAFYGDEFDARPNPWWYQDDTDEQMSVEENDGFPTIEVLHEGEYIWTNQILAEGLLF